jgi:acyl-CoA synthetase (AMP-forming)/AMP-acid ligase II/acyl carrier protein
LSVSAFQDFGQVLQERARRHPEAIAYRFLQRGDHSETAYTYRRLDEEASSIAAKLSATDPFGKPVLLLLPPGLDYIAAFFGCLYAGAIAVPTYPPRLNRSLGRLERIIEDAQPVACLTNRRILAAAHAGLQQIMTAGIRWVCTEPCEREPAKHFRTPPVGMSTIALLQYTSGSTTEPRGVMVTHGNLLHNSSLIQDCFGHSDQSRFVCWLPPYHDMGLVAGIMQPLFVGCPGILMPPVAFLQHPLRWLQALSREKATETVAPNFAYELCTRRISAADRDGLDLSSLRVAGCGSEPIRAEVIEAFADYFEPCGFRRESFRPCYGLAEATLIVSGEGRAAPPIIGRFNPAEFQRNRVVEWDGSLKSHAHSVVGCGSVCPGVKVVIVDPATGSPSGPEKVGEIWVGGQSVALGYWRRPQETTEVFQAQLPGSPDGWFLRTGDLGFLKDGQLFVAGRRKELIVIRGRNYYPQDIEAAAVRSFPDLNGAPGAAFASSAGGQDRLVIIQELPRRHTPWSSAELDSVIAAIREGIGEEHDLTADAIVLTEPLAIPKTSSGKIQRRACQHAYVQGNLKIVRAWTAAWQNPELVRLEQQIRLRPTAARLRAWLVLRVSQATGVASTEIDYKAPLSQSGLDSLAAVAISGELESLLNLKLMPTLVWDHPSVAELAAHLVAEVRATRSPPTVAAVGVDQVGSEAASCRVQVAGAVQ